MFDVSLRLPYLIYLAIGAMLLGVLVAPIVRDNPADHGSAAVAATIPEHPHMLLDVRKEEAPSITMTVEPDAMSGWNVTVHVERFTFTPGAVNGENVPNTGHAHIHVDGQKVARLYGPHFHLPALTPGQREIVVTLSSNNHSFYAVGGEVVEARTIVQQSDTSSPPG